MIPSAALLLSWLGASALALDSSPPPVSCVVQRQMVVCPVAAGSLETLAFVVDTGTRRTVLDTRVADRLNLNRRSQEVLALGSTVRAGAAVVSSLRFGPLASRDLPVSICDLGSLASVLGARPDGILGMDVLGQGSLTIDYRRAQVLIGPVESLTHRAALHLTSAGFPAIDVAVGGERIQLVLDTGMDGILIFSPSRALGPPQAREILEGRGLSGPVTLVRAPLPCLWIAGTCVDAAEATVVEGRELRDAYGAEGLLGPRTLNAAVVTLDFARHQFGWQPRE